MRPTVTEQLRGCARLLDEVVAAEVAGSEAEQVVAEVVRNLRMIESSWTQVLPFLWWDNEATLTILTSARNVPGDIAARIEAARQNPLPEAWDVTAVEARNDVLRELLSEVITTLDSAADDALHRTIREHLMTRAKRYPMRTVPQLSQSTAERSK